MLWQIHNQFRDGHTEMLAQKEINHDCWEEEMQTFLRDTKKSFPTIPKDVMRFACNEMSPHFVRAVTPGR